MQGRHLHGAQSPEHRQLGHLEPEIPGFAPPPHDELAFLDTLGIGIHVPCLEEAAPAWRFRTASLAGGERKLPDRVAGRVLRGIAGGKPGGRFGERRSVIRGGGNTRGHARRLSGE